MSEVVVRTATAADLPRMSAIYNQAIERTTATFDVEPRPDDNYAARVASTRPGDHVVVAQVGGEVAAYAFSNTYRPRPAYDGTREVSVYVDEDHRGRGLGRLLYEELVARLDADGVHTIVSVIAQPNPASEALHRALGFEHVGTLAEVGFKFGRWVDTALWQRMHPDVRGGGAP
ncbi:N-acetyltransferase [Phycicoccus endophyticus]|uniref:N-acetyltransferase n=1 Tax=Phycicoccus endophyticus TaxID=1690220 RepID=A0A7G9R590_9MICO|nr:GNAT family N-acetyltransferase [Phycicoccus endophyticus]NHI20629.1 N-acetyltransferase [Phycicoccus endophyticus]QNN50765.1 N-acetyltransferase [Phycicoccus endophyticus]GGL43227.1 N-acetyltransferase [Phycicoccus endophyticus]